MCRAGGWVGVLAAAALACATLAGCDVPRPNGRTAGAEAADGARLEAKIAGERARLERCLEVAQLNLAKARIEAELGELRYNDRIALADKEFELAKRRQQVFTKFTIPQRLARAALELEQTEHRALEAREELDQLTQPPEPGRTLDQHDAVLRERAQRRLDRAERDLLLRREEFQTLKEVTLPLEQLELDFEAERRKRAALQVQRDNESALLDRRTAVLTAEAEVERLQSALADLIQTATEPNRVEAASQPAAPATREAHESTARPPGSDA